MERKKFNEKTIFIVNLKMTSVSLPQTAYLTVFDCTITVKCIINVFFSKSCSFPVAQMVEHGASNAKIMGSIPRESKS